MILLPIIFSVEFIYPYKATIQNSEYEFWSYHPDLKWGRILVPEPVATQQIPAISFLLQVSSIAYTLAQEEHKQGGPGRLSWQHDRRGADHP